MTPVVLLHGQPGSGADFDGVVAALPPGTRALAPDRPGYGENPLPPGGYRANARWVLSRLDAAGIDRAVLVGHSWAGGAAITAAALAPERVAGLVLVASVGPGSVVAWDHVLAAPVLGEAAAVAVWQVSPWVVRRAVHLGERLRGRRLHVDEAVTAQTWGEVGHEHGLVWRTFLAEQRDLVRSASALDASLARVRAPAVVLADPDDAVVPVATARALHAALPGSRLELVDGGGHQLPRTRAEAVAEAITSLT